MRAVFAILITLALAHASTAVAIEKHLENFNKEVNDSLKTKINTLRNILLSLDFKQTADAKKALLKMEEFTKGKGKIAYTYKIFDMCSIGGWCGVSFGKFDKRPQRTN